MKKLVISGYIVLLLTGFAAVKSVDVSDEATLSPEAAEKKAQQDRFASYWCFKHDFVATLDSLGKGDIHLREAHIRVLASARQHNPDFFLHLADAELGSTDDERLAHNLVEHIRGKAEVFPGYGERLEALEFELCEFLLDLHSSGRGPR